MIEGIVAIDLKSYDSLNIYFLIYIKTYTELRLKVSLYN